MSAKSRTFNSIRNSSVAILNNIMNIVLGFVYRTIFVLVLSKEYLGLNGLFTNILSLLSIAELGIGSAIVFRLYKPVSIDDKERIIQLMNFYRRVYFVIALVVSVIGFSIMPALKFLIADTAEIPSDVNIYVLYSLFLLGQVSSYICVHKQSIIIADQREWIVSVCNIIGQIIKYTSMIVVLFITKNFTLVLVAQILSTLVINVGITILANKLYPFLRGAKGIIDKSERKEVYKETFALLNHRIGGAIVNGTDNILISAFIGLGVLGLYSNYSLIIVSVTALLSQLVSALSASVGNLFVNGTVEDVLRVYRRVQYINTFISVYVMLSFCMLINNFIQLWLGADYILDISFVLVITFSNLIKLLRNTNLTFINACGLYMKDKWRPFIEVIINLGASILLVNFLGLKGIFLGTIISTITVPLWREYNILNRNIFKSKKIISVVVFQICSVIVFTAIGVGLYYLFLIMPSSVGYFILKFIICLIGIPVIFLILTIHMEERKYLTGFISKIFKKRS